MRPNSVCFGRKINENSNSFKLRYGYSEDDGFVYTVPRMVKIVNHNKKVLEYMNLFPWKFPNYFSHQKFRYTNNRLNSLLYGTLKKVYVK